MVQPEQFFPGTGRRTSAHQFVDAAVASLGSESSDQIEVRRSLATGVHPLVTDQMQVGAESGHLGVVEHLGERRAQRLGIDAP